MILGVYCWFRTRRLRWYVSNDAYYIMFIQLTETRVNDLPSYLLVIKRLLSTLSQWKHYTVAQHLRFNDNGNNEQVITTPEQDSKILFA